MIRYLVSLFRSGPGAGDVVTWRPGDLAVCIRDDWWLPCRHCPKVGDVLRVSICETHDHVAGRGLFLGFADRPHLFIARMFRKAVADDQAADARFAEQLRRLDPAPPLTAPNPDVEREVEPA